MLEGSRTFQNGLSDPDFRCRPRQICERRGKDIKVEQTPFWRFLTSTRERFTTDPCVLANPWRKTEAAGKSFKRNSNRSHQRAGPHIGLSLAEEPEPRSNSYLARSFSVFFLFCPPFWHFFYIVHAIRPEMTSPETTRQLTLGGRVEEEGPRGLCEDTDGVIDQRRKRDSEDLPPAHSSWDSHWISSLRPGSCSRDVSVPDLETISHEKRYFKLSPE
ncbi:hypothetical protein GEV33_003974 [Tenebrio molitor]|uniref:Uncharacterized protein n=1 Tax=Tenebrio molitor TaxID=7067 RepID=A0A8J6HR44_TENMO|nr:hypothetical protein GEV33_003974 [Tenebrio molitor]